MIFIYGCLQMSFLKVFDISSLIYSKLGSTLRQEERKRSLNEEGPQSNQWKQFVSETHRFCPSSAGIWVPRILNFARRIGRVPQIWILNIFMNCAATNRWRWCHVIRIIIISQPLTPRCSGDHHKPTTKNMRWKSYRKPLRVTQSFQTVWILF